MAEQAGKAAADVLSLSLPNRLESLETARLALLAYLAPQALSDKVLFNLELVLEESLMNVTLHAFKDAGLHLIDFSAWCDEDAVYLRFEDEGMAFDPGQAAEPVLPKSIAEASPGGLGLMLVRKRAKSVSYERLEGRNRLTIALNRC
jgi:anti-sigma regulatory factor (Ser/Thr protein kinase)